ncbi:MAG: outer membrane protein assembly factor BamD [Alphaproteobacteria bacterium]|nr:outer membrane protein assembly factor BamD [Alphaproteobacteria bacterium]
MKKIIILTALVGILAGCGGTEIEPEKSMAELYAEAYEEFNDENYDRAAELFLQAESEHSTDAFAPDALVMAAYSRYLDDDFPGAIIAADRFMRFHPGHQDAPYVLYLRGMCYYRQVSDVRREPGMSVYALQQFEQLKQRFPSSEYAKNAENKINILKNYIAAKVMYSARTDMKRENWTSAITKFQSVVTTAQETVMVPEALYRLTQCYTAIGLPDQSAGYAEMLRKNFPDNDWTKKLDDK